MAEELTCQWCGASGKLEDFDRDEQNNEGFWCPDCDGFTYYDAARNHLRRVLLILEQKDGDRGGPVTKTKLKKQLSPLRYPGGKSKLIDFLATQFRKEALKTFVELFAGGASVGLSLLDAGLTDHLVINDTDPGIYAFWNVVVNDPVPLLMQLEKIKPNRAEFRTCQQMLDEPGYWSQENLAWATLVCNRLGFSGISKACALGGKNGTEDQLLCRWRPETLQARIRHIHEMADRITVSCVDAIELLEKSAYWNEQTTLFIDPPYVQKGKDLYRLWYEEEDHRQLAFIIQSLYQGMPGADIVITYDDCPLIREIYPYAEVVTVARKYSVGKAESPRAGQEAS